MPKSFKDIAMPVNAVRKSRSKKGVNLKDYSFSLRHNVARLIPSRSAVRDWL
jgi:hypothetical protein